MSAPAALRPSDNSIGFLWLALALLVLWGHSWYLAGRADEEPIARWLFGGSVSIAAFGVQGFFALSGFLVIQSEQRLSSTRRFLWHRLLRIYPGFWICLLVTALALPAVLWSLQGTAQPKWSSAVSYITSNWLVFYQQPTIDALLVQQAPFNDLNGSLWTLPYELGCYAVLAVLGWLGLTRPHSAAPWVIGLMLGALYCHDAVRSEQAWFFKSEGRKLALWFIAGALAANLPMIKLRALLDWRGALGASLAYLLACRFGALAFIGPLAVTALMLSLAWMIPLRDFEQRVGGDYSYGVYIYAYPVQQTLISCGALSLGMLGFVACVAGVTAVLAVASWQLVEKRALAYKSFGAPPATAHPLRPCASGSA